MRNLFYFFLNRMGLRHKDSNKIREISRLISTLLLLLIPLIIIINANYQNYHYYGVNPIQDSIVGIGLGLLVYFITIYPFYKYADYLDNIKRVAEEL